MTGLPGCQVWNAARNVSSAARARSSHKRRRYVNAVDQRQAGTGTHMTGSHGSTHSAPCSLCSGAQTTCGASPTATHPHPRATISLHEPRARVHHRFLLPRAVPRPSQTRPASSACSACVWGRRGTGRGIQGGSRTPPCTVNTHPGGKARRSSGATQDTQPESGAVRRRA